jgi:hypothetical protein
VLSVKITHFQQNSRFAALSEKSQGRNKKKRGHDYARAKRYPAPFFPKSKTAGRKMEAKKFLVFIFLPPYFCHGLFVWSYSPAPSFPCRLRPFPGHGLRLCFGCGWPHWAFASRLRVFLSAIALAAADALKFSWRTAWFWLRRISPYPTPRPRLVFGLDAALEHVAETVTGTRSKVNKSKQ